MVSHGMLRLQFVIGTCFVPLQSKSHLESSVLLKLAGGHLWTRVILIFFKGLVHKHRHIKSITEKHSVPLRVAVTRKDTVIAFLLNVVVLDLKNHFQYSDYISQHKAHFHTIQKFPQEIKYCGIPRIFPGYKCLAKHLT